MTPALTDRSRLAEQRARAARAPALFLHEATADEIEERLAEVNRTFTAPAVVTPFAQVWQGRLPGARIVPDDPVLALEPGAHDLVIHALALHWADDPVGPDHPVPPGAQARRAVHRGASSAGEPARAARRAGAGRERPDRRARAARPADGRDPRSGRAAAARGACAAGGRQRAAATPLSRPAALVRDLRAMGEGNALAAGTAAPEAARCCSRAAGRSMRLADAEGRFRPPSRR
jgi:hypothetical protein